MAVYIEDPAYLHLTAEQRVQMRRIMEEEGRRMVVDREVGAVEAGLRANVTEVQESGDKSGFGSSSDIARD